MDHFVSTSLSRLEDMLDGEKNAATRQKLLVVWHKKKGETERSIGNMLRLPRSTVGYWIRRFRQKGIKGLYRKPGSGGQNRYLTKEQEKRLQDKLKKESMTTKEALVYINKEFGKKYHPNSMPRLLKRLGQSLITQRKRHYKANPRSGWAFKGHIKKAVFVEI